MMMLVAVNDYSFTDFSVQEKDEVRWPVIFTPFLCLQFPLFRRMKAFLFHTFRTGADAPYRQ